MVVAASSPLVKEQFPDLGGFQLTNYSAKKKQFSSVMTDSIQFHFFNNRSVTSQPMDGKVVVYDKYKRVMGISRSLQKQLKELYHSQI